MYSNKQRLRSINMPNERANTKSKGDFSIRRELFTSKALGFFYNLIYKHKFKGVVEANQNTLNFSC